MEKRLIFDYDIAIVGAGPAGSTLARLLDRQYRVLIVDPQKSKPCGGLLSESAQKSLSKMALSLPKDVLVDPQIFDVATLDLVSGLKRHYSRHYLNMDRNAFDAWLYNLIPDYVTRYVGYIQNVTALSDGYQITTKTHAFTASYVVGADGANSLVRRQCLPKKKLPYYVAIQEWFAHPNINPLYACLFDASTSSGCSWVISKNNTLIYGGVFPKDKAKALFQKQKERLMAKGMPLGIPIHHEACMVLKPKSLWDFVCGHHQVFFVGEAAGFISPSSFEGFSYAFESAQLLAKCMNQDLKTSLNTYRLATLKLRIGLFLKCLKAVVMYHPWLRALVMFSGITSVKKQPSVIDDCLIH